LPNNKLDHIAFILDGNKRWAKKNNVSLREAYKEGLININNLLGDCLDFKLKYLTLFTLSSENIKRKSVSNIFEVIYNDFSFFFEKIINEKLVKVRVIGSRDNLPKKIVNLIKHCEEKTINNKVLNLNLAFNYGFKNEVQSVLKKLLNNSRIDINNQREIKELFFLGNLPDPDILIRTGGDRRLSNFIMYNLIYTEIFFIDTLWPDFNKKELINIKNSYKKISRRYGL
tara:strand:- start:767 stop:1450 length:684 start_codon:yes stop_codon:yes gene_type:complete